MKFCTYCGKELSDRDTCDCAGAQEAAVHSKFEAASGQKKMAKFLMPAVIAIIALIAVICVVSFGNSEIDLNEYLIIDGVTGMNGRGVVSYHLDEAGLYDAMIGSGNDKEVTEDNWESVMVENFEKYEEVGNALSCITVTATPETGLSNGDKVTVKATFGNTKGYKLSRHFKNAEKTITVSGLIDGKEVDPFAEENIVVTFTGFSGSGEAKLEVLSTEDVFSEFSYKFSSWSDLSNGDAVTLTVFFSNVKLEALGYLVPEATEKTYAVSGLGEYYDFSNGLTDGVLQELCEDALLRNKELEAYENNPITDPSKVTGAYLLTANVPGDYYLFLDGFNSTEVYNAVAIVTRFTFELEGYDGLFFDRTNAWIYPNWSVDTDGNIDYERGKVNRLIMLDTIPDDVESVIESTYWNTFDAVEVLLPQNENAITTDQS